LRDGRVFTPVRPLLTVTADRLWFDGTVLVVERGTRRVRVEVDPALTGRVGALYVAAGPILNAIGLEARYDPASRQLRVRAASQPVATPTPFNPALPALRPRDVFTPEPIPTPRPIWTGTPLPRRTALPLAQPPARA
jgi:hypothetical protein